MRPSKLLAFCGHDFMNIGDDALMLALCYQMYLYAPESKALITSSYLPAGCDFRNAQPIFAGMGSWRGSHLSRIFTRSFGLDTIVYWGGSIFHEGRHFDRESAKLSVLRRLGRGVRIGAIGVSIGPFHTSRQVKHFVRFLEQMDFITVRDKISYEFLEQNNIRTPYSRHFDLTALLLYPPLGACEKLPTRRDDLIGIAPCPADPLCRVSADDDDRNCAQIASALKKVAQYRSITCRIMEFNGHHRHGDQAIARKIAAAIGQHCHVEILTYRADPMVAFAAVAECRVFLSMRLHSAVFAFLSQTPLIVLSYHPKCRGFADEIGLQSNCIFDTPDICDETLATSINQCFAYGSTYTMTQFKALSSARGSVRYLSLGTAEV